MYKVEILLSTYNGEKYIIEQLRSIFNQKDVDIHILVRDDGSDDNTLEKIKEFNSVEIDVIKGSNVGFAQSFWTLIKAAKDADFYAFCDQDDYWLNDKLISAIEKIKGISGPTLYTSNVKTADDKLNIINNMGFNVNGVLSYADSLKKSVLPGCTFVFNSLLLKQLKKYTGDMIAHDWTCYVIANSIGTIVYDSTPHMLYRIHENNAIGLDSKMKDLKKKIIRFFNPKTSRARSSVAGNIYKFYYDDMSNENAELTYYFANYYLGKKYLKNILLYSEYRDFVFRILLLMKRV